MTFRWWSMLQMAFLLPIGLLAYREMKDSLLRHAGPDTSVPLRASEIAQLVRTAQSLLLESDSLWQRGYNDWKLGGRAFVVKKYEESMEKASEAIEIAERIGDKKLQAEAATWFNKVHEDHRVLVTFMEDHRAEEHELLKLRVKVAMNEAVRIAAMNAF